MRSTKYTKIDLYFHVDFDNSKQLSIKQKSPNWGTRVRKRERERDALDNVKSSEEASDVLIRGLPRKPPRPDHHVVIHALQTTATTPHIQALHPMPKTV